MNRLKFGSEKLPKCPDMVGQSSRHARRSLLPLRLEQALTYSVRFRDSHPQAHVWTREVVKRLEQDDAPFHGFTLFTETAALAHQRCQGMAKGLIDALNQGGANFQPHSRQLLCTNEHTLGQLFQSPLLFFLDQLGIDQLFVRLQHRLAGAASSSGARKFLNAVINPNQGVQVGAQAIAEEAGDSQNDPGRQLDQHQSRRVSPWPHHGRPDQPELRRVTQPNPLPSVFALRQTFPVRLSPRATLARNKVPHFIQLDVRDAPLAQPVLIEFLRFESGATQPVKPGQLGNTQHKTDRRELDTHQQHLQRHHPLFFFRPQIKEDRVTGLREPLPTATAFEDAPRAALRRVGRNGADVAPVHPLILITPWIGTRLIPVFSFSQEPSLLLSSFLPKTNNSLGSSLFQSNSG